jgi:hypothetical protein
MLDSNVNIKIGGNTKKKRRGKINNKNKIKKSRKPRK